MIEIFGSTQGVLLVIAGIAIVIFVHELGHFIAARRYAVKVEVFSIGFGPALWKRKKGDTEYRIALVPLGGFVKLAGEHISESTPAKPSRDDEFLSKPPLTRVKIFTSGALMNFLIAFPLCVISYLIGINFYSPLVGEMAHGSSEWHSSLQKGDIILSIINPEKDIEYPVRSNNDYRREVIRCPKGTPLKLKVNRNGKEVIIDIIAQGSQGMGVLPPNNIVKKVNHGSAAEKAGLKKNDRIIMVAGEFVSSANDISYIIHKRPSLPTEIKICRGNTEQIMSVTPTAKRLKEPDDYDLEIDGIIPAIIGEVRKDSPGASGGLQKQDRIIAIDNIPIRSWNKFTDVIKASAGKGIKLTVLRKNLTGTEETIFLHLLVGSEHSGKGFIGVTPSGSNEIGEVKTNSPLSDAEFSYGNKIIKASGWTKKGKLIERDIINLMQLKEIVKETKDSEIEVTIISARLSLISGRDENSAEPVTKTVKVIPKKIEQIGELGIEFKYETVTVKFPLLAAIQAGTTEVLDLVVLTFQIMEKLIIGEEPLSGLTGPVGIIQITYVMAREGLSNFLWLLALISVNLAILNLLPIPILDGGGILFCLIEKFKGSPVNIKVQAIAQYIGLFLLLSLITWVTVHDVFSKILKLI
jgi:regulator of sigma E protease